LVKVPGIIFCRARAIADGVARGRPGNVQRSIAGNKNRRAITPPPVYSPNIRMGLAQLYEEGIFLSVVLGRIFTHCGYLKALEEAWHQ